MREFKRLLVTSIYALLDKACQRLGAGTYFTSDKAYQRADISQGVVGKHEKARSRVILVFFGLDPAPSSF